jgi:hypothetical protein
MVETCNSKHVYLSTYAQTSGKPCLTTGFNYICCHIYQITSHILKLTFNQLKVDVYSFALIVFWIYSGVRPLINYKNPIHAVRAASLEDIRPPLEVVPDVKMRELLTRAWHKDQAERPTFEEIVDFLDENQLVPKDLHPKNGKGGKGGDRGEGGKCCVM